MLTDPTVVKTLISGLPLDSALTKTEDAKLFKSKKGKKPLIIQVKECAEVIDNVENSLAKPSTICVSQQHGNRGLTVARCVALQSMADGARDISKLPISAQTGTKVRTTWSTTTPNSQNGSPNDQTPSSPLEHNDAKASSPPISHKSSRKRPPRISHNRSKSRTAWLTPPSSARPSSSTHKSTNPRTTSTAPSPEHESNKFEKQNAQSDATEISGPWSSEVYEDVRGFSVPDVVDRSVRETPEPDIEEMGEFVASSRSSISDPRTPNGLPYEDYPTDDDEFDGISLSYDEPRYPEKSLGSLLEAQGELDGQN